MKKILLVSFIFFSYISQAQLTRTNVPAAAEVVEKVLRFYPNPAISTINFEFQKTIDKGYTLRIYNFVGKKVSEIISLTQKNTIALTDFYRGVYIFQLRDKSGRIVESGKFQVAR